MLIFFHNAVNERERESEWRKDWEQRIERKFKDSHCQEESVCIHVSVWESIIYAPCLAAQAAGHIFHTCSIMRAYLWVGWLSCTRGINVWLVSIAQVTPVKYQNFRWMRMLSDSFPNRKLNLESCALNNKKSYWSSCVLHSQGSAWAGSILTSA